MGGDTPGWEAAAGRAGGRNRMEVVPPSHPPPQPLNQPLAGRGGSSMGVPVAGWDQDKGPGRDTHQGGGHGRGGG